MTTRDKVLGAACAAVCACAGGKPPPQPPPAVRVEIVAEGAGSAGRAVYSAVAQPASQVALAFRGPGYVAELMRVKGAGGRERAIAEGDRVRKGDVLARLRDAEYRDRLEAATGQAGAARAAADKARADFERAERLFTTGSITRPEHEAARAQRDATRAQLSAAEAALSEAQVAVRDTALAAPLDGEVVKKSVEPGALAGPGVPAFVVADLSSVKVVLGLPDVALRSVGVGQTVAVTSEALPGRTFTARVSRIAAAADPVTRNFDVEVEIPNADRSWRAGMIAAVELGRGAQTPAVRLPLSAFVEAPGATGGFAVLVVDGDGAAARARVRAVELGELAGNRVAVTRGLATGERVITVGAALVADGQAVEIAGVERP